MAYRVELAKSAETQLEELYLWVIERAPQQGEAWFKGLEQAILSLEHHAERCPVGGPAQSLILSHRPEFGFIPSAQRLFRGYFRQRAGAHSDRRVCAVFETP